MYLLVSPGVERGKGGAENGSPEDSLQPMVVSELRSSPPSSPGHLTRPGVARVEGVWMPRASLLSQRSPGVQALMQFAMGKRRTFKLNWIKMNYLNMGRKTLTQTKKSPRDGQESPWTYLKAAVIKMELFYVSISMS